MKHVVTSAIIDWALVVLVVSGCRHAPTGPGNDSTSIVGMQSFTHARITLTATNFFTTSPYVPGWYDDTYDTSEQWEMAMHQTAQWNGNALLDDGTVNDSTPPNAAFSSNYLQTVSDSFAIVTSADGKTIQSFSAIIDSGWNYYGNTYVTSRRTLTGVSIPLVSSSPTSMVFALSGNTVKDHLNNMTFNLFSHNGCSSSWKETTYDSTNWQDPTSTPRLTITLTK
ncbi:MAG: hypothetical protein Q8922_12315 [Bacteroidota bacterium]|nr:hypothetical protein [Bacteroidota bacterium]MDP4233701.1 hypothetical protein [Bacteroidota bacterium]MDP4242340.1 hypothetical protein [Bacteroidota bacterium]MDP4288708.1 hypothetical protein [Bacteroidota bacterium]